MYDIENLEVQWRRYKRKRLLIPAGVIALLLGAGLSYFFLTSIKNSQRKSEDINTSTVQASGSRSHASGGHTSAPLSTEVPSMSTKSSRRKGWKMTFADSDEPETNRTATESSPAHHIDITVTNKKPQNTVTDIEKRFSSTQNKDDALFIARYYYDKKQYKKALRWSLETNKLDSNIEESWLLFGKAKAKLGQRMDAIRVLQSYVDRTGSSEAKKLLGNIRRGKAF